MRIEKARSTSFNVKAIADNDLLDLKVDSRFAMTEIVQERTPILKGILAKKNWYNNKQLREFHLYDDGEVKYYQIQQGDSLNYKGSFWLGPSSKITKPDHMTLNIFCHEKQRTYVLV